MHDFVRSLMQDLINAIDELVESEEPTMAKRKPKIIRKPVAPPVNEW